MNEINEIMNMVINEVRQFNFGITAGIEKINLSAYAQRELVNLIIMACIGLFCCFLGQKLVRIWAAVFGLFLGVEIGAGVASFVGLDENYIWIAAAAVGLVFAVAAASVFHAALFLSVFAVTFSLCNYSLQPGDDIRLHLIGIGVGLAAAAIALCFKEVTAILVTSVYGAFLLGDIAYGFLKFDMIQLRIVLYVVFSALGIMIQLMFESGKRKKRNLKKAEEIRKSTSVANEVERARAFTDSEDVMDHENVDDEDLEIISFADDSSEEEIEEEYFETEMEEDEEPVYEEEMIEYEETVYPDDVYEEEIVYEEDGIVEDEEAVYGEEPYMEEEVSEGIYEEETEEEAGLSSEESERDIDDIIREIEEMEKGDSL